MSADISEETASYTIKAFYPTVQGLSSGEVMDKFNTSSLLLSEKFVGDFKVAAKDGLVTTTFTSALTWAYDIKEQTDSLASVLFSGEQYIAGSAHPSHPMASLNFDLKTGQVLTLQNLFQPNSKYLNIFSDYTRKVLSDQNKKQAFTDEGALKSGTAPKEEMFKIWNITVDGLAITFPEYQVGPYVAGARTVLIPWSALKDIIDVNGPAASYAPAEKVSADTNTSSPQLIGGQKDEHGCLAGAGYSWCPSTNKCQRMWEQYCAEYKDVFRSSTKK